jgi:mono/diheme cytochrome c family protein
MRRLRIATLSAGVLAILAVLTLAQDQKPAMKKATARYTSPSSGQEMYINYCAACHGRDGKGNGPAAPALKSAPTDLTALARRNQGKFPSNHVYQVLKGGTAPSVHGTEEMPIWGSVFRSLESGDQAMVHLRMSNLTKYIESLQVK